MNMKEQERVFELEIDKDGKWVFICQDEAHNVEMEKEDAKMRDGLDRWEDGIYHKPVVAEVTPFEHKFKVPRSNKRPKVVREQGVMIQCPECQRSEKRSFRGWMM